jgi:predicted CopG family antitoxin
MGMGSVNISITDKVYRRINLLKRKDESFSQALWRMSEQQDLRACYGILGDDNQWDEVKKVAEEVRKAPWRKVSF